MVFVPTRRQALQLGGAALGVGLAGCSAPQQASPSETRVVELSVTNFTESQPTVHAVLQERDEIVYWSSIQATAGDRDKNEAGGGDFTDYPTEAGKYTLYAKADTQPNNTWAQASIHEWGWPCANLSIHLGRHDADRPEEVTIWRTDDCTVEATDE